MGVDTEHRSQVPRRLSLRGVSFEILKTVRTLPVFLTFSQRYSSLLFLFSFSYTIIKVLKRPYNRHSSFNGLQRFVVNETDNLPFSLEWTVTTR